MKTLRGKKHIRARRSVSFGRNKKRSHKFQMNIRRLDRNMTEVTGKKFSILKILEKELIQAQENFYLYGDSSAREPVGFLKM